MNIIDFIVMLSRFTFLFAFLFFTKYDQIWVKANFMNLG